jgi:SAM-dependent methyltransferase
MEFLFISLVILLLGSILLLSKVMNENIIEPFKSGAAATADAADVEGFEAFTNLSTEAGAGDGAIQTWLENDKLYDKFYAGIYDQITQGSVRTQAEVGLMLYEWTKKGEDLKTFEILDAGCGTGIAVAALAKMGVKKVCGVDSSEAMLEQARQVVIPQTTLTPVQKEAIEWRKRDLIDPSCAAAGEFSHAFLLYFTVYYFPDKESLFRNLFLWVRPGGRLTVMVVNKYKFDPMMEAAAPWMGFSLQKYTKDRITKSEVSFDKFKYTGEFHLFDPAAEFRETFRFQDGKVRRQKHDLRMENTDKIVGMAQAAGWKYDGYTDLVKLQCEYFYHLHFSHP